MLKAGLFFILMAALFGHVESFNCVRFYGADCPMKIYSSACTDVSTHPFICRVLHFCKIRCCRLSGQHPSICLCRTSSLLYVFRLGVAGVCVSFPILFPRTPALSSPLSSAPCLSLSTRMCACLINRFILKKAFRAFLIHRCNARSCLVRSQSRSLCMGEDGIVIHSDTVHQQAFSASHFSQFTTTFRAPRMNRKLLCIAQDWAGKHLHIAHRAREASVRMQKKGILRRTPLESRCVVRSAN